MATNAEATASDPMSRRKRLLAIVAMALAAIAIIALAYYFFFMRGHVETDNAYVGGNLVQATAQTAGTIVAVHVDDTQLVQAGDPLVDLDPVDAKVALDRAQSALARAVREIRGSVASTAGLNALVRAREAALQSARADFARAQQDVERRLKLQDEGGVSGEELEHARTAATNARTALLAAQAGVAEAGQNLAANEARLEGVDVANNPAVRQAAAEMKVAYIALHRATITAPVGGLIARKSAQVGARVQAGQTLMTIVPLAELWVDANFKEAQLRDVRVGQPAVVHSDLYGSDVEYHGRVVGLAAGTGSAFSLLPAQNATGNWIKVVQRVPVRIALDPKELTAHPLRIGLSMTVAVDTRDRSGSLVGPVPPSEPAYRTDVFEGVEKEAEARVQEVIAANLEPEQRTASAAP